MIISFSGKKQSGKDTSGKIAQILLNSPHLNNEGVLTFLRKEINPNDFYYPNNWEIKKFADKLKDIVCLLIGCTREQLEDEDFKSKELGPEWDRIIASDGKVYLPDEHPDLEYSKLTPRLLLQLLGTECGRNIIHPQIWVNALMANYVEDMGYKYTVGYDPIHENDTEPKGSIEVYTDNNCPGKEGKSMRVYLKSSPQRFNNGFPNWIITDMRFPNEQQAVDIRDGITIRVNRKKKPIRCNNCMNTYEKDDLVDIGEDYIPSCPKCNTDNYLMQPYEDIEHESETALDNAEFDYTIDNNGTMDELINKVREILTKEKLL